MEQRRRWFNSDSATQQYLACSNSSLTVSQIHIFPASHNLGLSETSPYKAHNGEQWQGAGKVFVLFLLLSTWLKVHLCGHSTVPSVPPAQGHECRLMLFEVQKIFFILIQAACRRVGWEENGYSCSCRSRRGNCCWCCRLENEANQTWVGFYIFPNCLFSQSITNPLQPKPGSAAVTAGAPAVLGAAGLRTPSIPISIYSLYSIFT